jgi:anti-sigma regulatory factor (Ser/Thr protein kinase)
MEEWHLTMLRDNVEILVTELITNAVTASRSLDRIFPVRLWLYSGYGRVLILVWDASPQVPTPVDPDDEAESGRGLLLVENISDLWGWYPTPKTTGKVVWSEIRAKLP